MKNKLKQFILISICFLAILIFYNKPTFADVGDFETYSGSSSSSSWSSDSSSWDYGDSSYDRRDRYSGGGIHIVNGTVGGVVVIIVFCIIIYYSVKNSPSNRNANQSTKQNININEEKIVNLIKATDELFNKDEFLAWSRDLFIKLQYAWSDRDWSIIRCFETNELFEQHSSQLERYKKNGQINKIERVSVNWAKLYSYNIEGDKEVLSVALNSKMIDYIIDEKTEKIIRGNNYENKINTYKLTFVRKKGIKTKEGNTTVNTTNCPNCGAPTEITSAGKCSYCGSVITTGEYNWVLSGLERL